MDPTHTRRTPYPAAALARLIAPGSVAVVGVSERAGSFGNRVVANMAGFDGRLFQVNARHRELSGLPCHPSLSALPEVPDCVVVATGRDAVEPILAECARLGVGSAIILAAGFAETGKPELATLQARLVDIARAADMRLVGPKHHRPGELRHGGRAYLFRDARAAAAGTPCGRQLSASPARLASRWPRQWSGASRSATC